jgi:hypothetical protein
MSGDLRARLETLEAKFRALHIDQSAQRQLAFAANFSISLSTAT